MNPFRLQVKLNKHRLKAKPIMSSSSSSQSQPLLTSQPGAPNTYTAPLEAADQVSNGSTYKKAYITTRRHIETFLASRAQHWIVLTLVSLDLLGIFADIIINLYQCDEGKEDDPKWNAVRNGLGIAGLVFSCLFMLELLLSLWAFGWFYFKSYFHTFDAIVILAGFTTDVLLHGVLEEVASLVVILRLWRFFKIIEEFSVGAEEQMAGLEFRIEQLESENQDLKLEVKRQKGTVDEEEEIAFQSGSRQWK